MATILTTTPYSWTIGRNLVDAAMGHPQCHGFFEATRSKQRYTFASTLSQCDTERIIRREAENTGRRITFYQTQCSEELNEQGMETP